MMNAVTIGAHTVLSKSPDAVSRTIDGEEVIVQPKQGMVTVTSVTGSAVWTMLDGVRSVSEIADQLCVEFDVDQPRAMADSTAFLQDLLDNKLVVVVSQ